MPARHALEGLFNVELRDLGDLDQRLCGIWSPESEIGIEKIGITEQFLSEAEAYDARYRNSAHFSGLFAEAFTEALISPEPGALILDIGTGSGANTIQPCLAMFADCQIVATDLSPDLLRMLRRFVVAEGLEERVSCVCTDATNDFFKPGNFDVVVGAAILHHLIDPTRAMAAVHRALKPGGVALFFEPFEGAAILRLAFDLIVERSETATPPLGDATRKLLVAMSVDYEARAGSDKSAPHYRHMDDKWLFTRDWLTQAARKTGFTDPVIVPHASHATLFRDFTVGLLRLGAGLTADALPDWGWAIINQFDRGFSAEMKRDILLEGTIVLRKRAD